MCAEGMVRVIHVASVDRALIQDNESSRVRGRSRLEGAHPGAQVCDMVFNPDADGAREAQLLLMSTESGRIRILNIKHVSSNSAALAATNPFMAPGYGVSGGSNAVLNAINLSHSTPHDSSSDSPGGTVTCVPVFEARAPEGERFVRVAWHPLCGLSDLCWV